MIHHNTIKRAAANSVLLKELTGDDYLAHWPERNIRIHRDDPKRALDDMLAIKNTMAEYRGVKIIQDENGTFSLMKGKKAISEGEDVRAVIADGLEQLFGEGDEEEASEGEDEAFEADVEDEPEEGSIVKSKYRQEYKARGTPTNCNDWLAQQYSKFAMSLKPAATREIKNQKTGKTRTVKVPAREAGDAKKHYAIAKANGVTKTWPGLNPGQECMNSRNMVRAVAVKTGMLHIPGTLTPTGKPIKLKADGDWLEEKRSKGK